MKVSEKKTASGATAALDALLYQLLETEMGGLKVYQTALQCVVNPDLEKEWKKYLSETEEHVSVATQVLTIMGRDPEAEVPARLPIRAMGEGLVRVMETALEGGVPAEAELAAAECVIAAETKDHLNWELLRTVAEHSKGDAKKTILDLLNQVEKQEDHHLYHTMGWARELWIKALGFPSVLPPPEEQKDVETAIGAARAKSSREQML